ncbi:hypothetical protein [Rickettsia sp. MEAM1 (Bemisia tabaci)]|uniref:hypothetical protein n=1 Tax=Rickettsia sp. MEAM1 (Bemisia tabaci) TaxID=1182263 RepID=UPI0012FDFD4C|nr:hypothetical protein [Rickettsia sp. MEAM1 (Bemisia tabaci)]
MLLLFYKSFPVIAQYLIYTSLNLTVPFHFITPQLIAEGCLVYQIFLICLFIKSQNYRGY